MKRIVCIAALLVTTLGLGSWLAHRKNASRNFAPTPSTASEAPIAVVQKAAQSTKTPSIPTLATRKGMSDSERLKLLEQNGEVFKDADMHEYELAQRTSWWGKPLDPVTFWKGRVVWLDGDARKAANRRGREFPPMPYKDPSLPSYRNDDGVDWSWSTPEGPDIHYGMSSEERAFWVRFRNTHPKPPEDLEAKQFAVARRLVGERGRAKQAKIGSSSLETSARLKVERDRSLEAGYPEEAFSTSALFWSYVVGERNKYQTWLDRGRSTDSPIMQRLVGDLPVEASYIVQPLSEVQLRDANAWKFSYLQRLRQEKADEAYINAYLQAWNLSVAEVFGPTNR